MPKKKSPIAVQFRPFRCFFDVAALCSAPAEPALEAELWVEFETLDINAAALHATNALVGELQGTTKLDKDQVRLVFAPPMFDSKLYPAFSQVRLTRIVSMDEHPQVRDFLAPAERVMRPMCRRCGCVDTDCEQCIGRTDEPCSWIAADLCSACLRLVGQPFAAAQHANA